MLSNLKPASSSVSTWLTDAIWILILFCIYYAVWIGGHPLFTPDEGRYSEVAREMVMTGDYITPRLNGVVFLDKPILYYWLQASAIKWFGISEAALRLWPALIGILTCLFVYLAGRQFFSRRAGLLAALILATAPLYYGAAHYANLDLEVAAFISMTLLSFSMATKLAPGYLRNSLYLATYVFAGLAVLTKGLIGIVLPGLIIGTWILLLNRWYLLKNVRIFSGLLIFCCITIPWYVLAQLANPQFFHFFFVTQQFSRFLTMGTFNNQEIIWFYVPIVAAGLFPWIIFLPQAAWQCFSQWKTRQTHAMDLFLLLWVVIIFTFFSIPRSKTIGYILPIFPGIALLIANYLDRYWNPIKSLGIKAGIISYLLITIAIFILCMAAPSIQFLELDQRLVPYITLIGVLFLISGIILFLLRNSSFDKIIVNLLITSILFTLTINASTTTLNQKTIKPLALYINSILQPNDEIVSYYKYYQDLPMYLNAKKHITITADWSASDIPLYDNWLRELWYNMPFQDTREWLIYDGTFWKRWHSSKHLLVLMNKNYFHDFQEKAHSKIYQLNHYNDVILVSNKPIA